MTLKTRICPKCNAVFVVEFKNQYICNECLETSLEKALNTPTSKENHKYKQIYKKNYKRGKK